MLTFFFVIQRSEILIRLAKLVLDREPEILSANAEDLKEAISLSDSLHSRLKLTSEKLQSLSNGLHQLAKDSIHKDNVGHVIKRTLVGDGLTLEQKRVPIGVLLVIFESRPDCLIQVGNGCTYCLSLLHYYMRLKFPVQC